MYPTGNASQQESRRWRHASREAESFLSAYCLADQAAVSADGSEVGEADSRRRGLALRTQVGRLSLPGLPQRRQSLAAIEGGPAAGAVLSGTRRSLSQATSRRIRFRWRDHRRAWQAPIVRRVAATHSPR